MVTPHPRCEGGAGPGPAVMVCNGNGFLSRVPPLPADTARRTRPIQPRQRRFHYFIHSFVTPSTSAAADLRGGCEVRVRLGSLKPRLLYSLLAHLEHFH